MALTVQPVSTIEADPAPPAGRPLELLEREITELAGHIQAATCRWLVLVAEFDRREGWAEWGCRSCAQWLSHYCFVSPATAREQVRVAGRLTGLPAIRSAFGRGELSYSQVRALSRVATPALEEELLEIARHATAAQLERVLRAYRGVVRREASETDLAHGDRYVVYEHDDDGTLLIRARLPADEGALVVAALEAGRDLLRGKASSQGRGVSAEAEPSQPDDAAERPSASNVEALLLMARTVLDDDPADGPDPCQVVVHVDAATLTATPSDESVGGGCQLEAGEALSPETARRLACDAGVVRILERDGRPLSVGRRTRTIPTALRRALQTRDRCCRFPGCTQRRFLHAHHLRHWAHGGPTQLANLIQLCRHHHRLVHEGGYSVNFAPDTKLRFRRADGSPVPERPEPPSGTTRDLKTDHHRRGLEIKPRPNGTGSDGTRLDLPLAVDSLLATDSRPPPNAPRAGADRPGADVQARPGPQAVGRPPGPRADPRGPPRPRRGSA